MAIVRNFKCPNCGASITNLNSPTGICGFCNTPYIIEGLKQILSEGIKGGTTFTATPDQLHDRVLEVLASNRSAPTDIFDSTVIESCESFSVPAYYCHYNGSSNYLVELGTKAAKDTNWTAVSGNTSAEVERIISGNSEYDNIVNDIYNPYRGSIFLNVENLTFDPDTYNITYNRPAEVLLEQFVRPEMEKALTMSTQKQLDGRQVRNLSSGNLNIEKDGTIDKVIVGVYHVSLTHSGSKFDIYTSSDAVGAKCIEIPTDPKRANEVYALEQKEKSITSAIGVAKFMLIAALAAFLLFHSKWLVFIASLIVAASMVYCLITKNKELKEVKQKIDEFNKVIPDLMNRFKLQGKKLAGIERLSKEP